MAIDKEQVGWLWGAEHVIDTHLHVIKCTTSLTAGGWDVSVGCIVRAAH